MTGQFSNNQSLYQPAAIDAVENIWAMNNLLGKWTQGGMSWHYVKGKGFSNKHNTWEKQNNINTPLSCQVQGYV